ncbi:hypothetical protein [Clostridium sp. Ade.TY]|uniref:hypothetical protein n=1 Tax=Clostridium sp. Ade.TY TaxID=1391647 RepID=UPI00126940FA|nr:hypothetical protein [Clostridium sp. Ade.TY]
MMLKKGINIKILKKSTKGDTPLFGKIIGIYKNYMVVNVMDKDRKKYLWNECFNVADIIDPYALEFLIKKDKVWTNVTKDMIPKVMLGDRNIRNINDFKMS